jgi:hypothetical protein
MNIGVLSSKERSYGKKIIGVLKSNKTDIEGIVVIDLNENGSLCVENKR